MNHQLARRTLLAGLGTTAAAALLRPLVAQSQTDVAPQRLLTIHRPDGTVPSKWFPTGGIKDWVTSPILSAFDKLRSDMVVMRGVDCPRVQQWLGDKHGAGMIAMMAPPPMDNGPTDLHVWPALPQYTVDQQNDANGKFITSPDMTIDQLFLQKIRGLRGAVIPSLQLTASLESANAAGDCCNRVISYSKPDPRATFVTPLWPEVRPSVVLQNLFGLMTGMSPDDLAKSQALDKSMLDFVSADINRLRPRLPASQIPKIDAHLEALRQLETTLGPASGRQCMPPVLGPLPVSTVPDRQEDAQYLTCCQQQSQLIKTAFQCDLTRVISFTFASDRSPLYFMDILPPGSINDPETIGNISHNSGGFYNYLQAQEAIDKFFCDTTASLLLDMKNTPDGATGGSLLDNTLVVFWNECSVGSAHDTRDMPVLAFGGKFLKLQGGSYLQFGNSARTMSDFWVQTAQAWGYSQMTSYGAPMWNKGPLPGLYG